MRRALAGATLTLAAAGCAPGMHAQSPTPQSPTPQSPTPARRDPGLARLEAQLAELAKIAGGEVGVAAVHLESGRAAYLNRGERFPMASTFKVPIAVELLTRVDRGELRLDSMIAVRPGDLHPGSGTLTSLFNNPGVVLSVRNLMELMLRISDNSATDILLREVGGGAAVTQRMRALGAGGIRVDRPTVRLIADYIGIAALPHDSVTPAQFDTLRSGVPDSARQAAVVAFVADPRDTSTPEGMALLLEKIWRRQAVSEASSALLLDIMYRCLTGEARIKGVLPPGTRVAHKTGSLGPASGIRGGRTVNDVGIVDLPGGAGHVVTVVFVKNAEDAAAGERAIAQIARAAYDYFAMVPAPGGTADGRGAAR